MHSSLVSIGYAEREDTTVGARFADGKRAETILSETLRAYLESKGWENSLANMRSIFVEDRGTRLHLALWERREKDPCIIFIHGMGLHSLFFASIECCLWWSRPFARATEFNSSRAHEKLNKPDLSLNTWSFARTCLN